GTFTPCRLSSGQRRQTAPDREQEHDRENRQHRLRDDRKQEEHPARRGLLLPLVREQDREAARRLRWRAQCQGEFRHLQDRGGARRGYARGRAGGAGRQGGLQGAPVGVLRSGRSAMNLLDRWLNATRTVTATAGALIALAFLYSWTG